MSLRTFTYSIIIVNIFLLASCVSTKPVQYLENRKDTTIANIVKYQQPIIQPGDILSVMVYSDNPAASAIYNAGAGSTMNSISTDMSSGGTSTASIGTGSSGGAASGSSGYLVTEGGVIIMPGVGKVPVAGFTCQQLADSLEQYFTSHNLLSHPACDVRFLSYKVAVMGEVAHPGLFSIPTNKVNILEALSMAGDFTVWSLKDNVTVIRDEDGKKVLGKIDLTRNDAFLSPYFILKQNDIVMVGANNRKIRAMDQTTLRYVSVGVSVLSTIGLLVTIFKR